MRLRSRLNSAISTSETPTQIPSHEQLNEAMTGIIDASKKCEDALRRGSEVRQRYTRRRLNSQLLRLKELLQQWMSDDIPF